MAFAITGTHGKALQGQVALISGGGTGIGLGIARAFVREGAKVALTGRRLEKLAEAVAELERAGGSARAVAGDVSNPADAARMVAETVQAFGKLTILVNNAGVANFGKLEDTPGDAIERMIDIDLKGPLYLSKAALPELRKQAGAGGASILNISSSVTSLAVRAFAVYSAAKAGLDQLTRCLALDHAAEGIRVNGILPGMVETPIFETAMPKAAVKPMLESGAKMHPLGRIGSVEDIAEMAVFLSSPAAAWITGARVNVDGGIGLGS